jgi:hypothetical protein
MEITAINALEIFKRTERSNCGQCRQPGCMAFAALAARGQADPGDCPFLDAETISRIRGGTQEPERRQEGRPESALERLRHEVRGKDLAEAAPRLGAWMQDGRLALRCLGRVFEVDREGGLHSMCHINPWIHASVLQYVVHGQGRDPEGRWITLRDLKGGRDWERFFEHRCRSALQQTADRDPSLFLDALGLFGQNLQGPNPAAEHNIILHPLPKVPFLFCYSPPEARFDSVFNILFDQSIEANLTAESIYLLAQGIAEMLKRITGRHGL